MKKKGFIRSAAMALAVCMIVSFAPVFPAETAQATDAPYTQTIEFNAENIGSYVATDAKVDVHGWEVDKNGTSSDLYANLSNPDSQRYPQFFKTYAAGGRRGFALGHMAAYFNWGTDSLVLTFKINNEVEGEYDISAVMYDYPNSMAEGTVSVNGTQVGTYVNGTTTETAYTEVTKELGKKVKLNKGANTIAFTTTNDKNGFNLVKLILEPAKEGTEPETPVKPEPITLNFDIGSKVSTRSGYRGPIITDATKAMGGWQLSSTLTDEFLYTRSSSTGGLAYTQYMFVAGVGGRVAFQASDERTKENKFGFVFDAKAGGEYDLTASIYSLQNLAGDIEVYVKAGAGEEVLAGTVNAKVADQGWTEVANMPDFKTVTLAAGENAIILKASANDTIAINNFTFTPVGSEDDEEEENGKLAPTGKSIFLNYCAIGTNQKLGTMLDATMAKGGWAVDTALTNKAHMDIITSSAVTAGWYSFRDAWNTPGLKINADPDLGDFVMYFNVPDAGWYDLSAVMQGCGIYSGKIKIALMSRGNRTEVGEIDLSGEGESFTQDAVMPDFKMAYLEAGTGYIIITGTENGNGINNVLLKSFTLEQYKKLKTEAMLVPESSAALVGESVGYKAWVNSVDGGMLEADDMTGENSLTVTSSDESVAIIENGKIKAVGEGTCEIKVTAVIDGETYEKTAEFKVIAAPDGEFKLVADAAWPVKPGRRAQILVQGAYSNVVVNMENAQDINVECDEEKVTATTLYKNGNLYVEVKGVSEGETEVTLSAKYNGKSAEVAIPIKVDAEGVEGAQFAFDMTGATWENLSVLLHGIGVNKELTAPEIMLRQGWVVYLGSSAKVQLNNDESVYFDINVPADGEYVFSVNAACYQSSGMAAAFYVGDEFIGVYDFADEGDVAPETLNTGNVRSQQLRNVKLTAGRHILRLQRVGGGNFTWIKSFTFTPVAESPTVVGIGMSTYKNTFTPGESLKNEFGVRLSDGRDFHVPGYVKEQGTLNTNNLMPERLDYLNNVMKAKKTGRALIQIDADIPMDGGKVSGVWTGTISEGQLADFTVARGSSKPVSTGVYEKGWAVNEDKTTVATSGAGYILNANGFNAVFNDGEILALDTFVQNTGIYNVDAAIAKLADGAVTDVYIGEKYLGRMDFANDSESVQLNTVELEAGINTIYIKKVGGGDKIALKQLSFVRVDSMPEFSHVAIENDTSEIALNKTLQAIVKVMMKDGRQYHIGPKLDGSVDDDNKIVYSADPTGIFSVDASTGLMRGEKTGDATLKAAVTVKGVLVANVQKDFSVVHVLKISTADPVVKVLRTETSSVELSATLDDAAIEDFSEKAEFDVIPADFRAEGYVEVKDGKATLYVKGLRGGETTVDVEAVYNNVVGRVTIPVTVSIPSNNDGEILIDFMPTNANRPSTPQAADIFTHGWEVNEGETSAYSLTSPTYKIGAFGLQTQVKNGEQFAFDVWVRMSGNYAIEMTGTKIGPSGICAGVYVDGVYLGEFNFAHPTSMSDDDRVLNEVVKLNSVNLSAGRHTIVLKKLAKSRPHAYEQAFWLGALKFTSIEGDLAFDYVEAKAGKNLLCVGESTEFSANAYMTDGNIRYMADDGDENNRITIANSNPAVAEIRNGRIHALSKGETTITVSATVDGVEKLALVDIAVDDAVIDSVEATLGGDLSVGQSANLSIKAFAGEREVDLTSAELTIEPADDTVVSVFGSKISGLKVGTTDITVTAKLGNSEPVSDTVTVNVVADGLASFNVSCASKIRPQTGTQISVTGGSLLGEPIDLTGAEITYSTDDTSIVSIDGNGYVTGLEIGEATIKITVKKGIFEGEQEINIIVTNGKVGRSYYTDEKVANAMENVSKYVWARNEKNNAVANADYYVDRVDELWNMVTTHALPRSSRVGFRYDPGFGNCRYCNVDLTSFGDLTYVWEWDAYNKPWKIQCPNCRRQFPTNDFGSFYKLGIDENGEWNYEKSHQEHYNLFAAEYAAKGVESYEEHKQMREDGTRLPAVGYLKNTTITDVATVATVNNGRGLQGDETVEGWGVDDGFGYKPGHTYETPSFGDFEESHTYIAYYNRRLWANTISPALNSLSKAYMYTGERKYARAGAVLLDRVADIYPTMYWSEHFPKFASADGSYPKGRVEGRIWETSMVKAFIHAYDIFYPVFDDPQIVSYLSGKAKMYNMENTKATGDDIRKNIEDGVLREVFKAVVDGDIHGNFGMHQERIADTAVILDSMPESREMLDYLMAKDTAGTNAYNHTGGDVMDKLINGVDRDGGSEEGITPNYSMIWYNCISSIAEYINGYKGYAAADLFKHPKVQKMLENLTHIVQLRSTSAAIGDSGLTAGIELNLPSTTSLMRGFRATNNVLLAQTLYFLNGNTTEGLHEDIFTKNPNDIQDDIQKIIDEHGEYPFDSSLMLAEQGYTILRDGSLYGEGTLQEKDTQHAFWMNFGFYGIHSHADMLNLGVNAYGLDFAPDLGYPTQADGGDEYTNWGHATVNHNTVVVDDSKQRSSKVEGFPMHFDDAGRVKIMDVDASVAYDQTDIYRRTVIMVEANDDISYGVDFFRVRGGTEHLYSFHSQSNTVSSTSDNFTTEEQIKGTYAGESVPYRTPGITSGYSYFTDVRKAEKPGVKDFYVDYLVEDFRNLKKGNNQGLHMRLTMLNDFEIDEISLVKGETPVRGNNPRWLEFMLARRSSADGTPLDTTFTTVLEPYKESEKYISSIEQVDVSVANDSEAQPTDEDVVRAIKVTLKNGREDYIVYASNSNVKYLVGDKFTFRGFAGVCSYVDGEVVYSYLADGTDLTDVSSQIGISAQKEYTGEVIDFTRELVFDNIITVKLDGNPSVEALKEQIVGRWMYIENNIGKKNGNAAYLIKDINEGEVEGTYDIALGNTTLIRSGENVTLEDGDFTYNIAPRQWFNIPLSQTMSTAPVFESAEKNVNVAAGKKFSKTVAATSPAEREITYTGTNLPRGASVDSETGTITWTPDNTQVGENHVAIMADDGLMQTTHHFDVTVYKSAGSAVGSDTPSADIGDSGTDTDTGTGTGTESGTGTGTGSGTGAGAGAGSGAGASGGGGGSSSSGDTSGDTGNTETGGNTGDDNTGDVGDGVLDVPSEKFIDLGAHTWAKDAIYALVEKGVVNGTSESTYSPANNIKRADFAIMLVRAFGIKAGEGENFADVDANKYYAEELRLAKANGIVGGIGDNKFNPDGEITRQDMMLMLYRALKTQGYEMSEPDESVLAEFTDAALISDYARDAIAVLVKDGIIAGAQGKINPKAQATRAEIAVMLSRVLAK